jgi:hypothetical protein
MKSLIRDTRAQGRDLNLGPPEHCAAHLIMTFSGIVSMTTIRGQVPRINKDILIVTSCVSSDTNTRAFSLL